MNTESFGLNEQRRDDQVWNLWLCTRGRTTQRKWYLYYSTRSGVRRRPMLGLYPTLTIDHARTIAREIMGRVAMGEDPQGEWKASRMGLTVTELWDIVWLKHYGPKRTKWAKSAKQLFHRCIEKPLGGERVNTLSTHRIRVWHRGMSTTPNQANRALAVLSRMYNWLEEHGLRKAYSNPCASVSHFVEKKRARYATDEELVRISRVLVSRLEQEPQRVAFIFLLMLTGSRMKTLAAAKKTDFRGNILFLPGKVTGELDQIVIPEYAMKNILPKIPLLTGQDYGKLVGRPPNLQRWWLTVVKEAKVEGLWARDLRRTFATKGITLGYSLRVIGDILNHRDTRTTERYAKVAPIAREKAVNEIGDKLAEIAELM